MSRGRKSDALARERSRRTRSQDQLELVSTTAVQRHAATTRRAAARDCAWCGTAIDVQPVGRIPKWCSARCRQRAWEQSRAAASGLSAVRVVERVIERPIESRSSPRHDEWPPLLRELAVQLDHGDIYQRDLPELTAALTELLTAYRRHH